MIAASIVWTGLGLLALGALTLVRPLPSLGISTRRRAAAVSLSGAMSAGIGFALPAVETRVARPESRLDEFVPVYQFHERHEIHVDAGPREVYRAVRSVSADEIWLFQTLTFLRRFGRPGPESILDAPESEPLLDVATSTSFLLLAEEEEREIVVGSLVRSPPGFDAAAHRTPESFQRLSEPGFAKAAMSFRLEPGPAGGTRVTTETRVYATDEGSRRRFALYWRVIFPGSALIRRMWLRAIRERAEATTTVSVSGALEVFDGDDHFLGQLTASGLFQVR